MHRYAAYNPNIGSVCLSQYTFHRGVYNLVLKIQICNSSNYVLQSTSTCFSFLAIIIFFTLLFLPHPSPLVLPIRNYIFCDVVIALTTFYNLQIVPFSFFLGLPFITISYFYLVFLS